MKAAETDLAPSERLFVQVGLRVRIRLAPAESLMRTWARQPAGGGSESSGKSAKTTGQIQFINSAGINPRGRRCLHERARLDHWIGNHGAVAN